MRVVALLGLGMDPRAALKLCSLVPVEVHHQIPNEPGESLKEYAHRWGHHLQLHREDVVIGMSFGGPIALEMGHQFNLSGVVLISTFTDPHELPRIQRTALNWGIHRWIPYRLGWYLGKIWARRKNFINAKNQRAIEAIKRNTSPAFYRWIIDALGSWPGTEPFQPVLRIHGTADQIIPLPKLAAHTEFIEGNHFLLATPEGRSAISEKIDAFIQKLAS